jgi:hypothetical protein
VEDDEVAAASDSLADERQCAVVRTRGKRRLKEDLLVTSLLIIRLEVVMVYKPW